MCQQILTAPLMERAQVIVRLFQHAIDRAQDECFPHEWRKRFADEQVKLIFLGQAFEGAGPGS